MGMNQRSWRREGVPGNRLSRGEMMADMASESAGIRVGKRVGQVNLNSDAAVVSATPVLKSAFPDAMCLYVPHLEPNSFVGHGVRRVHGQWADLTSKAFLWSPVATAASQKFLGFLSQPKQFRHFQRQGCCQLLDVYQANVPAAPLDVAQESRPTIRRAGVADGEAVVVEAYEVGLILGCGGPRLDGAQLGQVAFQGGV